MGLNRRTKSRDVGGMMFMMDKWTHQTVTVRVTKDTKGKTLSLNVGQIMILIPIEPVEDMIDVPSDELVNLRQMRQLDGAEIIRLRREIQTMAEQEEEYLEKIRRISKRLAERNAVADVAGAHG